MSTTNNTTDDLIGMKSVKSSELIFRMSSDAQETPKNRVVSIIPSEDPILLKCPRETLHKKFRPKPTVHFDPSEPKQIIYGFK